MSIRVCFADLDGVVADPEARFKRAEEAKQAFLNDKNARLEAIFSEGSAGKQRATEIYWRTVFTPELVRLDTPIEGAIDALATLAFNGWEVILLTSRPEAMREATSLWLFEQGYPVEAPLVMKAPAFQYTKTTVWKAGMVETLARLYSASTIIFVDDEEANQEAVMQSGLEGLWCYSSLASAVESLEEQSSCFFATLQEAIRVAKARAQQTYASKYVARSPQGYFVSSEEPETAVLKVKFDGTVVKLEGKEQVS